MSICCRTLQLLEEEIGSGILGFTTRTGQPDSMEAADSSALTSGKALAFLVENGVGSMWQFQREPAVPGIDVACLDDSGARWRMTMGGQP